MDGNKPGGMVKSDETLFSIIEALRDLDGAGVTELADHLGMAKSAVHKHLKTLAHHGYAVKRGNAYRLGFKYLTLGGHVRHRDELCRLAGPQAEGIAGDLGVVAVFSVEENGRGVVAYQENELSIDLRTHVGTSFDLHASAHGKAMLSLMSDDRIGTIADRTGLPKATDRTIGTRGELFEEIETVRERGFAISIEEIAEGEASVAVPLEHPDVETIGALSVSCPVTNTARSKLEGEYAERLFEAVSEIRYQLSG